MYPGSSGSFNFLGWQRDCFSPGRGIEERCTNDLIHLRFPRRLSPRAAIAAVNLVALAVFVVVELGFSYFNFATPWIMWLVAAVVLFYRGSELALSGTAKSLSVACTRVRAIFSICAGILIPFALAAATRQFHTHYFGLLILPVLESALYCSLFSTLMVAAVCSCSALLWVAYAAHFTPPFQLGELLEAATLILLLFTVGALVWLLLDLLGKRESELRDRLHDLEITRGRLVEGEKLAAIGRLASAVAHEIRNPVAIISSALEAARSSQFSVEDREEMSKVAMTEARRLERLTTDFLSYAQPGDLPCTQVDVMTLVGYIASIARAQAITKSVKINLEAEDGCCQLYGNEDQLQQAVLNLLRNAVDASPEAGQISVRISQHGALIRIAVENEGPSIPDFAVPRLFEPFFTAKSGGTGLGLSIAKKIAEKHGGDVTLERNAEQCILFALILPAYSAHARL